MRYFLVNQGDRYKEESAGGYIWAPKVNKNGKHIYPYDLFLNVRKGDILLHNSDAKIMAISIAKDVCYDFENPFKDSDWLKEGRKIDLDYQFLTPKQRIRYMKYLKELLSLNPEKNAAFCSNGANLGKLYQLTKEQFDLLVSKITDNSQIKVILDEIYLDESHTLEDILDERREQESVDKGKETAYSDEELAKLYESRKNEKPTEQLKTSKRIKTNPRLKATCLRNHNYLCEVDANHKTFMNTKDEHEYMESHHFIPVKAQIDFPNIWLDDLFNLVCLCPTCHAQFHYGSKEAKIKVFNTIYKLRKQELLDKGIDEEMIKEIFNEYYF